MRAYDPAQPLIFIHVPKAAGTSVRAIFEAWFGDGLLAHYYDERTGEPPGHYDLDRLHAAEQPVVLYGHFNRLRGLGIDQRYPDVEQFVTILRDPFELALSNYFYAQKTGRDWLTPPRARYRKLEAYLSSTPSYLLDHFPMEITCDNYQDVIDRYFVAIGFVEDLTTSMYQIGRRLGKSFDASELAHLNVSARSREVPPGLREQYVEHNRLVFDVYDYCREGFSDG